MTIFNKDGSLSKRGKTSITRSIGKNNKLYPKTWVKNGRNHTLQDDSVNIKAVLRKLKLKHSTGNDSPRGGKEGDYIKISSPAMSKLKKFVT